MTEALAAAPAERPFVTAWIDEDEQESLTFGEFRELARGHAAALLAEGVGAGDRVVIIMPQGIAAMASFVGAMMLGAAPAFLAYPNFKVGAEKYRSGLTGVTANLQAKLVLIDEEFPDDMLGHVIRGPATKLVRMNKGAVASAKLQLPPVRLRDIAFIQHSAGTTGLQKGVALTHGAVLRQLEHLREALRIDPETDRIYSWLPLYHDMGLIACFILPMVCHVPVVMQSALDWVMHPETMLEIISAYKCTLGWLPNFAFQFVARKTQRQQNRSPHRVAGDAIKTGQPIKEYDPSSLRALINCSEPVRASSMREYQETFGVPSEVLQSSYAMAENVFAVTQSELGRAPARVWANGQQFRGAHRIVPVAQGALGALSFTSSGRLLPGQEVRILSESGEVVGDGRVGEILIKSDCLFDGYFNRPDLTAQAMIDGWYRSGDLGFLLDGELYVVGRKKDLLIIGGENIYPQDIEEIVAAHPAVHDGRAVAIGLYNAELGTEEIVVVAEVERNELLRESERIEQEIRSRIVAGMGVAVRTILLKPPKWIVKSTAGKPARAATREKLWKEHPEFSRDEIGAQ